ncbi:MAG: tol-pal system-associated acyl-CoA thioesterase [Cocleimonas sp.]|nr:tol-pal system-associated acyl-CoA thioesterase [Cocleimonas sp.]
MIEQNTNEQTHRTFILPIRVYYEDTDAGGVVYHSNYINFFERARTEWLRQLGYELDELARDEQLIFVVRAVSCEYLRPAIFNDELFVSAEIINRGNTSIQFEQKVMRVSKEGDKTDDAYITLAKGVVTVVSVDSNKFKPKRLPKHIIETIEGVA